jgi:DnaJ-class molecular chaperone
MKKCLLSLTTLLMLTSCADIASIIVEDEMQRGLKNGQTNQRRTKADDKKLTKQEEALKKEGKCPVCKGMGKTPDGLYVCETCKGTGKYEETNNKQE